MYHSNKYKNPISDRDIFKASGGHDENQSLCEKFSQWFEVRNADTKDLIDEAYRLRFQVYCIENAFENREEHRDGREIDEFDTHAAHTLLVHRPTGDMVGAVRLVLPLSGALDDSFPIQRVCHEPLLKNRDRFPLETMGELSRFALSKEFRRRSTDTFYGSDGPHSAAPRAGGERRDAPPLRLGLMRGIVQMSVERGLTHWCAVMEPSLLRILRSTSIHFEPIGPLVNFHGTRQPCYGSIQSILERLRREQEEVWDFLTDRGRYWELLTARAGRAVPELVPAE